MRVPIEELKEVYAQVPEDRAARLEWLLKHRDGLDIDSDEALQEFDFISDEVCKLIGARLCILATKKELQE